MTLETRVEKIEVKIGKSLDKRFMALVKICGFEDEESVLALSHYAKKELTDWFWDLPDSTGLPSEHGLDDIG